MNTTASQRRWLVILLVTTAIAVLTGRFLGEIIRESPRSMSNGTIAAGSTMQEPAQPATPVLDAIPAEGTGDGREEVGLPQPEPSQGQNAEDPLARIVRLHTRMLEYATAEGWEETYAGLSAADLRHEQEVINAAIRTTLENEFETRFRAGQYEIVSTDGVYAPKNYNPCDVYQIRPIKDGRIGKCLIPEAGFEGIYKLKAQCAWLYEASQDRPQVAEGK